MWRWQQRVKPFILPGLVALLLLYTADQLLTGERGIVTWRVMKGQIANLQDENARLKAAIAHLDAEVTRLKGIMKGGHRGKADGDFIDELARRELGLVKPGDKVILRRDIEPEGVAK